MKIHQNKIGKYYMNVSSVKSKGNLWRWFKDYLKPENVGSFDYETEDVHCLSVEDGIIDLFMMPEAGFAIKQGFIELDIEYLYDFKIAIREALT